MYAEQDDQSRPDDWMERLARHQGVIIHEMLHAIFSIFACDLQSTCHAEWQEPLGNTAHGTAWQDAAMAIEQSSEPLLGEHGRVLILGDIAACVMSLNMISRLMEECHTSN